MDLTAPDNLCGQTLLRLSASGASIVAELLRLSHNIPQVFDPSSEEGQRYEPILIDFAYLKNQEAFERKLNVSTDLLDLDQEFFDTHEGILVRFYTLFESIVNYLEDYREFLDNLQNGIFIQYTTDNVLQNIDGKQLMCECLYLYGTMLLMLERHLPGHIREKLVITMMRHQPEAALEKVEDVCKLVRNTGYSPLNPPDKKPKNYPENFFARFPVPKDVTRLIIQALQSDDIYQQDRAFPSPDHRSTRLANQAAILFVVLFFDPDTLHNGDSAMRECVDKHFSENWIVPLYMGHIVDLSVEWAGYRAAKKALDNILTPKAVSDAAKRNLAWCREASSELAKFLTEGILTEQFLLLNIRVLLQCMRKSNVALRWRLLHRRAWQPKFKDLIQNQISANEVIDLLLQTAQLEFQVKNMFTDLLDSKDGKWGAAKEAVVGRLRELGDYFSGEKALTRVRRDERMMNWFHSLASEITSLEDQEQHATVLGRKLQKTISALEEVEQFEQIDSDAQIKPFLEDTREALRDCLRIVNVHHSDLTKMEVITDLSYGFELLNDYTRVIHERVRSEPSYSVLLRAGFVKLTSILDVPLTRINQIDSSDAVSVAEFYSGELVAFMRRVLDVIPRSVFQILREIISIQTHDLKTLPVKFESQYLKDYAQLDERYKLAQMTNRASTFTEGVLTMEQTALGIIQVDARQILHDGLRKELVRQVSDAMHKTILFDQKADISREFGRVMQSISSQMDGFRKSIEYIQDYVDMAGLKMWQEEIARIINYNIEQECNRYLKRKVLDHNSKYQNKVVPIPRFPSCDPSLGALNSSAINFTGRTMNALLTMTDPAQTIYAPEASGWYRSDGTQVCGIKTLSLIHSGLSVTGVSGLDRLLAFRIVHELSYFLRFHKDQVSPLFPTFESLREALYPEHACPSQATKVYASALKRTEKLMAPMLKIILKIGQAQLLRRQLSFILQFSCRLEANLLYQALTTMNTAVLNEVKEHYRNPEDHAYPSEDNPLLSHLNKLLEASGMCDPLSKIYVVTEPIEGLPALLFLFVLTFMSKLQRDLQFSSLVRRKVNFPLDGMPLVVGIWTLLKQFHPAYTDQLFAYMGQFVRSTVQPPRSDGKPWEVPAEAVNILQFMKMMCKVAGIPLALVEQYIPSYAFSALD